MKILSAAGSIAPGLFRPAQLSLRKSLSIQTSISVQKGKCCSDYKEKTHNLPDKALY